MVTFSSAGFFDSVLVGIRFPKLAAVQQLASLTMLRSVAPAFKAHAVDTPLVCSDDMFHDAHFIWSNAVVFRHLLVRGLFAAGWIFSFHLRTVERSVDVAFPCYLVNIVNASG